MAANTVAAKLRAPTFVSTINASWSIELGKVEEAKGARACAA